MTIVTTKDMTAAAKALWKATNAMRKQEAKLRLLKAAQQELEDLLLKAMLDAKQESIAVRDATISVKRTQFVELYDDQKFFGYVGKHKAWDLVRKQPVIKACQARWEDNVEVPGCRPGTKVDLSITARAK